jgi:hypothetical protein
MSTIKKTELKEKNNLKVKGKFKLLSLSELTAWAEKAG